MKDTTNRNQGKIMDIRMIAPMMPDTVTLRMRNESPMRLSIVSISVSSLARRDKKFSGSTLSEAIHDASKRLSGK